LSERHYVSALVGRFGFDEVSQLIPMTPPDAGTTIHVHSGRPNLAARALDALVGQMGWRDVLSCSVRESLVQHAPAGVVDRVEIDVGGSVPSYVICRASFVRAECGDLAICTEESYAHLVHAHDRLFVDDHSGLVRGAPDSMARQAMNEAFFVVTVSWLLLLARDLFPECPAERRALLVTRALTHKFRHSPKPRSPAHYRAITLVGTLSAYARACSAR